MRYFSKLYWLIITFLVVFSPNIQSSILSNPNKIICSRDISKFKPRLYRWCVDWISFGTTVNLPFACQKIIDMKCRGYFNNIYSCELLDLFGIRIIFCIIPLISFHEINSVGLCKQENLSKIHINLFYVLPLKADRWKIESLRKCFWIKFSNKCFSLCCYYNNHVVGCGKIENIKRG